MHSSDLSFVSLILNASVVVQLVMALLELASVLSWTIIFDRSRVLRRAQREAEEFEDRFWSGGDLGDLYRAVDRDREGLRGAGAIFHAGFREFARLRENQNIDPMAIVEGARLTVGSDGVLEGCKIEGPGEVIVHGQVSQENGDPAIVGPRKLTVGSDGRIDGIVKQHTDLTHFGFEQGCSMRMRIIR